ncbi:MAG: SRPBCC domain-containing protein [Flavobacteriales bacterium TMED191]|nr:MAG: SRPBCC domain-containing protein [Flavobacteriales bacterium TMED191]|tara:strand:+ start:335 stop:706 length:372 start_codon:yes stop_codon:yes gene_type:complete
MEKYELEFQIRSSVNILFNCLSTPSGLSEWFADDVNCTKKTYTFFWDNSEQEAELITVSNNYFIKFRWVDYPHNTFFEFRIEVDEITNDVILKVTDFAETEEVQEGKDLWTSQIHTLMKHLGS